MPSASARTRWRRRSPTRATGTASASPTAGWRSWSRSRSWPRAASASSRPVRAGSRGPRPRHDRRGPRLLRHPRDAQRPLRAAVRPLRHLPHRGEARLQPADARRLLPRSPEGGRHRDRARRAGARGRPLADGADGAVVVALGLGRHHRLQPVRRVDLPDRPRAPLQQVHPVAGRRAQGRDPRPRPPHGLPGGRHLGHGRLAPHRPRQRLLHRRLRPEADRPLRHPPRGDGPARGGRGAGPRARPLQAAPRAVGNGPRHRDERPRLLRAEPLPAARAPSTRPSLSRRPPTARSRSSASGSAW